MSENRNQNNPTNRPQGGTQQPGRNPQERHPGGQQRPDQNPRRDKE